jgi:DNA-binding XRE family transcriptional regulator
MEVKQMSAGEKIRQLRGKKSQSVVADELGITKSSLAMYERNERRPRDEVKLKIARYFGKSVEEIFFDAQ